MKSIDKLRNFQKRIIEQQNYKVIPPPLSNNKTKQLQELHQLRTQLDQINQNRQISFEQVLDDLNFRSQPQKNLIDPIKVTLNDIDQLINEYLKSGQRDQFYLNNLYKLREDYLKKVTIQPNQYYVQQQRHHYTNNSLPSINSNQSDTNNNILQYMRNEEVNKAYSLDRLQNIQKIKGLVENEILNQRAQRMAQRMNFYNVKGNDDDELQPEQFNTMEGFIVRFDFVSKLQISVRSVRISYGTFQKQEEFHPFRQTQDQNTQEEDYRTNKCIIRQKDVLRDITSDESTCLYLELWGFMYTQEPEYIGWTLFKLFDHTGDLLIGKYKLPIYDRKYRPNYLLDGAVYPYLGNQCIYIQIHSPHIKISDDGIYVETNYRMPIYHIHRYHKIFKTEESEIQKDSFQHTKSLKEREPQMFEQQTIQQQSSSSKINSNSSPLTNKSKISRQSKFGTKIVKRKQQQIGITPQSKQSIITQSIINESSDQIQQTSHQIPLSSGRVIIKIQQLGIKYENSQLKCKIGLFIDQQIIKDVSDKDCVLKSNLIPIDHTDTDMYFDFYCEFNIDYPFIFSQFQDKTQNTFIYMAFYDSNTQDLLGWYVPQLFIQQQSEQYKIKSGRYLVNLLKPPGQQAPFDEKKMIKSNIKFKFVVMANSEIEGDLDEISTFEEQKQTTKKLTNPKWNSQLTLTITQLYYFPSKENLSIKISLLEGESLIKDVLDRQCKNEGELEAFISEESYLLNAVFYVCFRVGKTYLMDNYQISQLNYVFIIKQNDQLLGLVQFPSFRKQDLQLGQFKANLYNIRNKKTKFMISFQIKESPLILDQYVLTEQRIKSEQAIQKIDKNSQYTPITISINHVQVESTSIILYITSGKYLLLNESGEECKVGLTKPGKTLFKIPLTNMMESGCSQVHHQVIVEIQLENEVVAWIAVNLLFNSKLYVTKLFTELFKPPILAHPIDFKKVQKIRSKIDIQIELGDSTKKDNKLQQSLSQIKFLTLNISINNLPQDGSYQLQVQFLLNQKLIQDLTLNPCKAQTRVMSLKRQIKDVSYQFKLSKENLPLNSIILIYLYKEDVEMRWCVIEIYQNSQIIEGSLDKKMLFPPFQQQQSQNAKPTTTDIRIELL